MSQEINSVAEKFGLQAWRCLHTCVSVLSSVFDCALLQKIGHFCALYDCIQWRYNKITQCDVPLSRIVHTISDLGFQKWSTGSFQSASQICSEPIYDSNLRRVSSFICFTCLNLEWSNEYSLFIKLSNKNEFWKMNSVLRSCCNSCSNVCFWPN